MPHSAKQPDLLPTEIAKYCAILGLKLTADALGVHASPSGAVRPSWPMSAALAFLPHWGVIEVEGPDAESFLQAQLSTDVAAIPADGQGLAAYCTPQGRMLVSMRILRTESGFLLLCSRELVAPIAQRLGMFVLRAKLKVIDRSADLVVFGLYGEGAANAIDKLGLPVSGPGACAHLDGLSLVSLHAPNQPPHWHLLVPSARLDSAWQQLSDELDTVNSNLDRWLEVCSGVPRITATTQGLYVPQMINFELIGGVGFRKGCYPGQEIVARTQYLGKLKRRMRAVHMSAPPSDRALWAPGTDIRADGLDEPVGSVVLAAPAPDGGAALLIETRFQTVGDAVLLIGDSALAPMPLPYEVPVN